MAKSTKSSRKVVKKTAPVVESVSEAKSPNVSVRFPKRFFVYALILLAAGSLVYFGSRLLFAASVNGQFVSRIAVIKELEKQGGKKTLDVAILKMLIDQEAKKRKISVPQKEIDQEMATIEKNVAAQGAGTLESLLAQQGMTKQSLVDEIRLQKLVTKMVGDDATVTEKEIDEYLKSQEEQQALLSSAQPTEPPTREAVKEQLKKQKVQEKIQNFVAELKNKAKITYFVDY